MIELPDLSIFKFSAGCTIFITLLIIIYEWISKQIIINKRFAKSFIAIGSKSSKQKRLIEQYNEMMGISGNWGTDIAAAAASIYISIYSLSLYKPIIFINIENLHLGLSMNDIWIIALFFILISLGLSIYFKHLYSDRITEMEISNWANVICIPFNLNYASKLKVELTIYKLLSEGIGFSLLLSSIFVASGLVIYK